MAIQGFFASHERQIPGLPSLLLPTSPFVKHFRHEAVLRHFAAVFTPYPFSMDTCACIN